MKFDEAINYIAESTFELEMAKPRNPEIDKLVAQGIPYWKARNMVNAQKGSAPATPAAAPAGTKYKELPDTLRTKDAVANYLQHNPNATEQEVLAGISSMDSEETPLNLDPEVVKSAMADAQSGGGEEQEPDIDTIARAEKAAKMARVKDAILRLRGLKSKAGRKPAARPEPEEEPGEIDFDEPKIDMRDEPVDPTEL